LELELDIARKCAELRDNMEFAAEANYRTFQIEVVRLLGNGSFSRATADNCYTLVSTAKPDKMALIVNKIKDYLYQLGFSPNDIKQTPIKTDIYHALVLKVEW
jgi:hypothetical protein